MNPYTHIRVTGKMNGFKGCVQVFFVSTVRARTLVSYLKTRTLPAGVDVRHDKRSKFIHFRLDPYSKAECQRMLAVIDHELSNYLLSSGSYNFIAEAHGA